MACRENPSSRAQRSFSPSTTAAPPALPRADRSRRLGWKTAGAGSAIIAKRRPKQHVADDDEPTEDTVDALAPIIDPYLIRLSPRDDEDERAR